MAEQELDGASVDTGLEQMHCNGMPLIPTSEFAILTCERRH